MASAPPANSPIRPAAWGLDLPTVGAPPASPNCVCTMHHKANVPVMAEPEDAGVYRSIVKLEACFENKKSGHSIWKIGTGWLVSQNLVVTAGDVVFDTEYQLGAATRIKCYVGYQDSTSSESSKIRPRYGEKVVTSAECTEGAEKRSRDIAFVHVAKLSSVDVRTYNTLEAVDDQARGCQKFEETKLDVTTEDTIVVPRSESNPVVQAAIPEPEKIPSVTAVSHCAGCGGSCGTSKPAVVEQPKVDDKPVVTTAPSVPADTDVEEFEVIKTPETSVVDSTEAEGFYETLKIVAKADTQSLPITSTLLGPDGSLASVTAGALLNSIVTVESIATGSQAEVRGAAERALLAEASLQAVLSVREAPGLDGLLEEMERNWSANAPAVETATSLLCPYLVQSAVDIAAYTSKTSSDGGHSGQDGARLQRKPLALRNIPNEATHGGGEDFIRGLFGPTRPVPGLETIFSSVGPVLKTAIAAAQPLVAESAKAAVADRVPELSQRVVTVTGTVAATASSSGQSATDTNQEAAARILLKRAVMADAALQALMALPEDKLKALKLHAPDASNKYEDIFDFIKTLVQKIGPIALVPAKKAAAKFALILVERPAKTTTATTTAATTAATRVVPVAINNSNCAPVPKKFCLREMLNENKIAVKANGA